MRDVPRTRSALICLAGVAAAYMLFFERCFWHNYGSEPPAQVFQNVTGVPIPKGATQVRIAGRQLFIKGWTWITFKATPTAQAFMTSRAEPVSAWELKNRYGGLRNISANSRYDARDKTRVGWAALSGIKAPRYYRLSHSYENMSWTGFLIVDTKSGQCFIQSQAD